MLRKLNNKIIIFTIMMGVVVLTGLLIGIPNISENKTSQKDNTFVPMYFSGQIAEAYQSSLVPIKEICRPETIQETKEITGTDFKILQLLPEKFKMYRSVDVYPDKGLLQLEYSYGLCTVNNPTDPYKGGIIVKIGQIEPLLRNDTISAISGLEGQDRIDKLSEIRTKTFENQEKTQWTENDRFVTINNHLAVITEPGYTTDRYWDYDTGELLYKEAVTHPGRITFIDESFEIYYSIKGYFSANELIQMAKSVK